MPLQTARHEQAGDVDAGHDEDQRDRSEQGQQQRPGVAVQLGEHGANGYGQPLEVGVGLDLPHDHSGQLCLRVGCRCAGAQAADHAPSVSLDLGFVGRHREPEIDPGVDVVVGFAGVGGIGQKTHARRHHADDRKRRRIPADPNRGAEDRAVAVELPLPQVVAQDDPRGRDLRPARLARGELAAEHRRDAEGLEEVAGDDHAAQRCAPVRQDEEVERPSVEGRRLDGAARRPPVHPLPDAAPAGVRAAVAPRRRHEHEPVRIRIWRRREEDALDQAEHRRRRSDPQTERDHGGGRKAGVLAQLAQRIANVVNHERLLSASFSDCPVYSSPHSGRAATSA